MAAGDRTISLDTVFINASGVLNIGYANTLEDKSGVVDVQYGSFPTTTADLKATLAKPDADALDVVLAAMLSMVKAGVTKFAAATEIPIAIK